ncbi:sodium/potassium-transporting ATPase subunit beta-2-like isoform X1 [Erpetoichthys calabaricus]|uniref:sodium/potassium-transporting ATPase subunit beta-2-like isoform X1 n=1 Tax=Erpetoichthys calabaricus TaxID=27687 RepID=UPI00223456BA|nr:sodium/potassium-transporting ATPase subunit beta-2-like isoform X1 [Erpetoichthys calabaricus]
MSGVKEKKSCSQIMDEWKAFMWNPTTHEFMGRTATSWALILLFYIVFYSFLTGLFSLTMWVMLQTLDPYEPTYQDRLSSPGVMIRPQSDSLSIAFTTNNTESWDGYTNALDTFLGSYNDSIQLANNDNCTPDQYFLQDDNGDVRNNPKKSCQFNRTMLENCSGIMDRTYGYAEGKPCVIIKMNRIIGFKPGNDTNPAYVSCTGMRYKAGKDIWNDDSSKVGNIAYYPAGGIFNKMYFPYYGKITQVNYSQPLVAVKFLNLTLNTLINVECKVVATNVATNDDRDKFAGRVYFSLQVSTSQ